MNISWYGANCVRVEAKEGSVLVEPFDPKGTGLRGPVIKDDVVLLSAYEQPPSVLERVNEDALLVRGPGEYEKKGIAVRGVQAYQDSQKGKELGLATVYNVIADEISVCVLGALGQESLTDEQREAIGDPDVLVVPSSAQGALDAKAAAALATAMEPKVIIALGASDSFVKQVGLPAQKVDAVRLQKKTLPADQTALYVINA